MDEPWLPQMEVLNDVLARSTAPEPPMRDIDGVVTRTRKRSVLNMHPFSQETANAVAGETTTSLPAPEQWLLTRLDEVQLAALMERHLDYTDGDGRSVHLASPFVRHFLRRHDDDALPTAVAVATLPIVLADGVLLATRGLDRYRGIVSRIQEEMLALMPSREDCTPEAVAEATRFLVDDWLV